VCVTVGTCGVGNREVILSLCGMGNKLSVTVGALHRTSIADLETIQNFIAVIYEKVRTYFLADS